MYISKFNKFIPLIVKFQKLYYITIMIIKQFPLLDKTENILFFDAKYSHARKEC